MSNVQGAPELLRLKDKEFRAFPLRDVDHEEFNRWTRREYLDRVKESTDDPALLRVALTETITMTWVSARFVSITVSGLHKLASLMCRDQKVDIELIRGNREAPKEIWEVFERLHRSVLDKSKSEGEGDSGN